MQPRGNGDKRTHPLVGRAAEVAYLEQCLETSLTGERQVVFVSGEPGIGKTTLIEAFLFGVRSREEFGVQNSALRPLNLELPTTPNPWIGHGQCIEQYGAGEAFMPLLEIAGQLCRGSRREQSQVLLRQYAPSWLVQLPFLVEATELEALHRQLQGSTRERMLREAAEVLTVFTRQQGLVLVLEDIHWSDVSTLEWLSYIAQRREPAKLLIIGTYRPTEVLVSGHPLRRVIQELMARNRCEELRVPPLAEATVSEYLQQRFRGAVFPLAVSSLIHRRTGGNPLFMVNVVEDLIQQGMVREEAGQWQVQRDLRHITGSVPDTLRYVIERQVERLPEETQHLLEVASVAGVEFSAAAVAAGLQAAVEEVDHRCETLARQGQFIQEQGTEEWPDGTFSERYSFRHALYHAVLYERLTETQRVRLHRRIAERKEAAYGGRAGEIAAELAAHFEAGRDLNRAIPHLHRAGENALQRYANQEAIRHLTKELGFLNALPDSPQSLQQELALHIALGPALIATKGYAASEVEHTYRRARELCQSLADPSILFPALFGLWSYFITRAEPGPTRQLAEQMFALARQQNDAAWLLQAHRALAETFFVLGEFALARTHGVRGKSLYNARQHRTHVLIYAEEPGVFCHALIAWALWNLGYPDQALRESVQALSLAREASHPFSLAMALTIMTQVCQMRGDSVAVREHAREGMTLATTEGFPFWETWATILHGWALAQLGQGEEGSRQLRQALEVYPAIEFRTWNCALLAEAYERAGRIDEGLNVLAEALGMAQQTSERFYEAELHRLRGELLLVRETLNPHAEAEACFLQALEVSRKQQAKSLELRATMSLARLWQSQGKVAEARQLLDDVYGWFTEGFDTKDVREAEALFVSLGGSVRTRTESQKSKITAPRPLSLDLFSSSLQPFTPHTQPLSSGPHTGDALSPTSNPQPLTPNTFRNEGEYWTLTFAGTTCRIRDTLGMRYLAQVLTHPHEELHVLTLAAEPSIFPSQVPGGEEQTVRVQAGLTDAGEVLDPQARAAYRQRLRDLQEELTEAQAFNDPGRSEKLQAEIEFLTQELAQAVGLGGRSRKAASVAERARINVTKRIKIALRKISAQHPTLGEHLAQTIQTGTFCVYTPSPRQTVTWQD